MLRHESFIKDARKLGFFWHWLIGCFLSALLIVITEDINALFHIGAALLIPFVALMMSIFSYLIMNLFPKPYAWLQRKLDKLVSVNDLMY